MYELGVSRLSNTYSYSFIGGIATMSTATRPSVAATATALLVLTTPFVQPPGCDSHFTLTNAPTSTNTRDHVTSMMSVLSSLPVASCYPSGWDSVISQSRFHFSPAVCPSGWTYYDMADLSTISTAFCCNRSELHQTLCLSRLGQHLSAAIHTLTLIQWLHFV